MDNPFAPPQRPKRGDVPAGKNTFQRELDEKVRRMGYRDPESGQGSEDELDSDDDLLQGFSMTSKNKPKWTPPGTKKPLSEQNGRKSPHGNKAEPKKPTKAEILFGKSGHSLHDSESEEDSDDENLPGGELMMTMKKPWKSPSQLGKTGTYGRYDEDEVDADIAGHSRYDQKKKPWQPPATDKLNNTPDKPVARQRPKSPKQSNLDLDSIKEEREPENPYSRPKPQPRGSKNDYRSHSKSPAEEMLSRSRGNTPRSDLFNTSKKSRSPSPKDKNKKSDGKKSHKDHDDKQKPKNIMDMLGADTAEKNKKKGGKKKSLLDDDSDDSIGAEYGRKDMRDDPRKNPFNKSGRGQNDQGSPYDRSRTSPFDRSGSSPYDKSRSSPYDKARASPFDNSRASPFGDRSQSPGTSEYDRKRVGRGPMDPHDTEKRRMRTDEKGGTLNPFGDSVYEKDGSKGSKDKHNPYDKRQHDSRSPSDARRSPFDPRHDDDLYSKDRKRDQSDDRNKKKNPYDKSTDRYKNRSPFEKSDHSKNRYDRDDSNERDDRRGKYGRDDKHRDANRSPFDPRREKDDRYSKDRRRDDSDDRSHKRNPFDKSDDRYKNRSPFEHSDYRKDKHGREDSRDRYDGKDSRGRYDRDDSRGRYDRDHSRNSPYDKRYRDEEDARKRGGKHVGFGRDDSRGRYDDYDDDRRHRSPDRREKQWKSTRFDEEEQEWNRKQREKHDGRGRSKSRDGHRGEERESSVCRDVDKDPSVMRRPDTEEEAKARRKGKTQKSYTTENTLLDQVINSVKDEQSKFKPIDPDSKEKEKEKESKPRSQSARRPKPRYAKPQVESFPTARPMTADFNSTHDIRDAVYLNWYAERTKKAKEAKLEKQKKEKEEEDKKKKDEEDRVFEAKASYNAWLEAKKEKDPEKVKQKRREIMKEEEKNREKYEKKKDAEKNYRYWKENKDVVMKEQERKKKREEQRKREEEQEAKELKRKDNESAKKAWERKKVEQLENEAHDKRKAEAQKEREEKRQQAEREREARQKYDTWMAKKERDDRKMRKTMKERRLAETDNPRPAWSPANRTIPVGR